MCDERPTAQKIHLENVENFSGKSAPLACPHSKMWKD